MGQTRRTHLRSLVSAFVVSGSFLFGACSAPTSDDQEALTSSGTPAPTTDAPTSDVPTTDAPTTGVPTTATQPSLANPAPDWLGTRTLPTTADGLVTPQTTPKELLDRRIVTVDTLPAPPTEGFFSTIGPFEGDVLARSTWAEGCPVGVEDLRYVTVSFWGFDGLAHTGELIIHATEAENVVTVFAMLFEIGYPMEEMRIITPADIEAPPTGDANNTGSFVCRAVTGGSAFSEHAYGLAIDVNPFHNPYERGSVVLPELAAHYLDRNLNNPGIIGAGSPVVAAFAAIGWEWGGDWSSLKDYQHFALNNR